MNCKQAKENMERLVFGGLREDEAAHVTEHVQTCHSCAMEQSRYEKLKVGLERDWVQPELPAAAETLAIPEQRRRPYARLSWVTASVLICAIALAGVIMYARPARVNTVKSTKHNSIALRLVNLPKHTAERMPSMSEHQRIATCIIVPRSTRRYYHHRLPNRFRLQARRQDKPRIETTAAAPHRGWEMRIEAIDPVNKRTTLCCRKMCPDGREESLDIQSTFVQAKGDTINENASYLP